MGNAPPQIVQQNNFMQQPVVEKGARLDYSYKCMCGTEVVTIEGLSGH